MDEETNGSRKDLQEEGTVWFGVVISWSSSRFIRAPGALQAATENSAVAHHPYLASGPQSSTTVLNKGLGVVFLQGVLHPTRFCIVLIYRVPVWGNSALAADRP